MKTITKATYNTIESRINKVLKSYDDNSGLHALQPRVEVLERGSDGLVILLNDDAYDLAEFKGQVQDLFHDVDGSVYNIAGDCYYLEPFDSMTFKVAL